MNLPHRYYQQLMMLFLERLTSPSLDDVDWRARYERQLEKILVKERVWQRTAPLELVEQARTYLDYIEHQLTVPAPTLQLLKGYCDERGKRDYSRMVEYKGALLDERARASSLAANDDREHATHGAHAA